MARAAPACASTPDADALETDHTVVFEVAPGPLVDALDRISEQSGLQIVYTMAWLKDRQAPAVTGTMSVRDALDRVLGEGGIGWHRIAENAVAIVPLPRSGDQGPAAPATSEAAAPIPMLDSVEAQASPAPRRSEIQSSFAYGIDKPLVETPRSVSLIDESLIDDHSLSAIDDLVRLVPSTFTPTRFGIQGGIDIRGVPGDIFFRGMKRLNLQGHVPTLLSAMQRIEIVRGPPSPIYGMGKIGGYINTIPRTGGSDGGDGPNSWLRSAIGSYEHREGSFNHSGTGVIAGRNASYDLYGSMLDSDSYARGVPLQTKMLQAAFSLDQAIGRFRLEAGMSMQSSTTAGALLGRVTQAMVDDGIYLRGTPLVDLDLDGDGTIGLREMYAASPASGALRFNNQALRQAWSWPVDAQGKPLSIDAFPVIPGIPQSLYDYLVAHPEADPAGLLRAQGVGGPLPSSGQVPVGFAMDPRSLSYDALDRRRFAAYERELRADLYTFYFELIDDTDPARQMKHQLFSDVMRQYKISNQPFGTRQRPWVVEDKFTASRHAVSSSGLRRDRLLSVNVRYTNAESRQCPGDYATHRTDVMAPSWNDGSNGMTPNTTFTNCLENSDALAGGYPFSDHSRTRNLEIGAGALFDMELSPRTSLTLGGRLDASRASNVEYAGTTNIGAGTSTSPGVVATQDQRASAWDFGPSWTGSVLHKFTGSLHGYLTVSRASVTLDNSENLIGNDIIRSGHIGSSQLLEAGFKSFPCAADVFLSGSIYRQQRVGIASATDASIGAEASSTRTRGWEIEARWTPSARFAASFYAMNETTRFSPNYGVGVVVDARTLGFADVVDPATGKVVYPAEAFLYGGRAVLALPAGVPEYQQKQGTPSRQLGFNLQASANGGWKFLLGGNYFSSTYASRLKRIRLPSAYVLNAGIQWSRGPWQLQLDGRNLLGERYFRAKTGDRLGDVTLTAMPELNWMVSVRRGF